MRRLLNKLAHCWRYRSSARRLETRMYRLQRQVANLAGRLESVEGWQARELVRRMFETPEGRAVLDQWFGDSE